MCGSFLLKFDDQRKVIFEQRNRILGDEINDLFEVHNKANEGVIQSYYYEDYIEDITKEFHTSRR